MHHKINNAVLHWVLRRILSSQGWASKQLTIVLTATMQQLKATYSEDNHATTAQFMREVLEDVITNQKPL